MPPSLLWHFHIAAREIRHPVLCLGYQAAFGHHIYEDLPAALLAKRLGCPLASRPLPYPDYDWALEQLNVDRITTNRAIRGRFWLPPETMPDCPHPLVWKDLRREFSVPPSQAGGANVVWLCREPDEPAWSECRKVIERAPHGVVLDPRADPQEKADVLRGAAVVCGEHGSAFAFAACCFQRDVRASSSPTTTTSTRIARGTSPESARRTPCFGGERRPRPHASPSSSASSARRPRVR